MREWHQVLKQAQANSRPDTRDRQPCLTTLATMGFPENVLASGERV